MDDKEILRNQLFTRVRDFGAAYSNQFASSAFASERLAVIDKVVNELAAFTEAQIKGGKDGIQGTATKAELREELRDDLAALIRTARSVARQKPGIDEKFRMPRGNNDQLLIGTARVLAAEAAQFADELIRRDLPAAFLEEFGKKISMFEKTVSVQNTAKRARTGATAAIDRAIEQGMEAVRDLDAVVRNKFRDDSVALAEWASANYIERPPRPAVKKDAPAVATN